LRLHIEKIPRNVSNCVNCGHCNYGCSHESKQSTIHALLEPLLWSQYQDELQQHQQQQQPSDKKPRKEGKLYILPDCKIDQILYTTDKTKNIKVASGIVGEVTLYEMTADTGKNVKEGVLRKVQSKKKIHILANQQIVCAAGSIQTPALLLRSKFTHPLIGCYLTLHPVVPCIGIAHTVQVK